MAFFKLNQPRGYNHNPIFYDEDKEIHDKMVAKAKKDLGIKDEDETYVPDIKGRFRASQGKTENEYTFNFRRRAEKKSNKHLLVLIVLLVLVLFFCSRL